MGQLQPLLQRVIERWRENNVPIRPGVDDKSISQFESRNGVKLSRDMREYFATVDGTGEHFDSDWLYRFWPLDDVRRISEYVPELVNAFPESIDCFFFFDHSIDLFLYAIRLSDSDSAPAPIARVSPQPDHLSFDPFCDSFTEFISKYVSDPGNVL